MNLEDYEAAIRKCRSQRKLARRRTLQLERIIDRLLEAHEDSEMSNFQEAIRDLQTAMEQR